MEITNPYVADLIIGRLSWAAITGEDPLNLDRLVERADPYLRAASIDFGHAAVQTQLAELVDLGLVDLGPAVYGEPTYVIVSTAAEADAQPAWREQARDVARAIVDGQHNLQAQGQRITTDEPDEHAPTVDASALFDAVQTLDLLDRAPHQ